jgi:hypothetical protein
VSATCFPAAAHACGPSACSDAFHFVGSKPVWSSRTQQRQVALRSPQARHRSSAPKCCDASPPHWNDRKPTPERRGEARDAFKSVSLYIRAMGRAQPLTSIRATRGTLVVNPGGRIPVDRRSGRVFLCRSGGHSRRTHTGREIHRRQGVRRHDCQSGASRKRQTDCQGIACILSSGRRS